MTLKRNYHKPELQSIPIDREIALIMMTDEYTPPSGPRGASAQGSSSELNSTELQDNPFGTYTKD